MNKNIGEKVIPFIDLKIQFKHLEKEIRTRIDNVLKHGNFIMGPEVRELEEKLAEFVNVKHCIGCASGTDALLMALMAYGVSPGDAIFTTPFTFIATAEVISLLGATPVFVDVDAKTFNIDPDKLELAIKAFKSNDRKIYPLPSLKRQHQSAIIPRGVITVDLFGLPCEYDKINTLANSEDFFVIEDAAQGLGGEYKGRKACSLTEIGCTSFFPAKPIGGYGDGGAVFTNNDLLAQKLESIRVHGKGEHKYDNIRIGINGRLDTLQAAILLPKLKAFPIELELRQQVAQIYYEHINPCSALCTPFVPKSMISAWAQYSVLAETFERRTKIQALLKEEGIPTAIYYPTPLHLLPVFRDLGYKEGDFPVSENISRRIFSLPMHPYLEKSEIEWISKKLLTC
ncbi:DegT/DnrJ/EryC1/StrS family aminotransferase [Thermodesulfobacteriota bacterium]